MVPLPLARKAASLKAAAAEAWERVQWYRCRWGIEEWHRLLKTGCHAEAREFKTAAHL